MIVRNATHLVLLIVASLCVCTIASETFVPITRVADIRSLSRDEAAKALPVKISGTSIWTGMGAVVVDDGEQSIWVTVSHKTDHENFDFRAADCEPGSHLVIEGITDPGGYAPIILPRRIYRDGKSAIRDARKVSIERLISGCEDGQRVEIDGILQEFIRSSDGSGNVMMSMVTDGYFCRIYVSHGELLDESKLVDARVRVRGILAPDHNARAQIVNLKLLTSSVKDIDILITPPSDPFASPHVSLNRLALFSPDTKPWQRKVTTGIVVMAIPGKYFFLQDGNASARINSTAYGVKLGQRVEVAGFVDRFDNIATIKNAVVRQVGYGEVPKPLPVTAEMLFKSTGHNRPNPVTDDAACRMVSLIGTIQRIDWITSKSLKALWVTSGDKLFPVYLPLNQYLSKEQFRSWAPGALVELTGICELKFTGADTVLRNYSPSTFHILLPGPESVKILQPPPWWNNKRMRVALASVCIAVLLLLAWTALLRRQVARQSKLIGDKIASEMIHAERARIARDLHDSIEQQLTGVSLHLYGAKESIASDPQSAAGALDIARRMLKHTQRETRNSIRNLRSTQLERRGLKETLLALAADSTTSMGPDIQIHLPTEPFQLEPDTEYQILRLAQEALGNALKHSQAKHISINLVVMPQQIILHVKDDGRGFQPDALDTTDPSHFGMLGMQERVSKIKGTWAIQSSPGQGTAITIQAPILTR